MSIIRITIIFFAAIFVADAQEHGRIKSGVRRGLQEDHSTKTPRVFPTSDIEDLSTKTPTVFPTSGIDDHSPPAPAVLEESRRRWRVVNSSGYNAINLELCTLTRICDNHDLPNLNADDAWNTATNGKACHLTAVGATLIVNGKEVLATPFTSSGTLYTNYAIIRNSDASHKEPSFMVTRIQGGSGKNPSNVCKATAH